MRTDPHNEPQTQTTRRWCTDEASSIDPRFLRRCSSHPLLARSSTGRVPVHRSRIAKELWLTLPVTESLLHRLGWDDGWEAAFAEHRAAGLAARPRRDPAQGRLRPARRGGRAARERGQPPRARGGPARRRRLGRRRPDDRPDRGGAAAPHVDLPQGDAGRRPASRCSRRTSTSRSSSRRCRSTSTSAGSSATSRWPGRAARSRSCC